MRPAHAAIAVTSLLLAARPASADPGATPLDLAPFAALDAAPFRDSTFGFSELTVGPGAVRDDDPKTAWEVPGEEGATGDLTFDWSGLGDQPPFPVSELRIDIVPAEAAITVATGLDRGTLDDAAVESAVDGAGVTVTLQGAPTLRVLRLRLPAGAQVARIAITGGPTTGTLGPVKGTCDGDGVHLEVDGKGLLGVEATRALPGGGSLRLTQRRTKGATITDAGVRFDPRPSTYSYLVHGVGSPEAPVSVTVACEGEALSRPPAGPMHGVIEGFYGRPWTWHEREKVVLGMGALGLDTYVYAPKEDPKHRDAWREPYDAAAMGHFKDLADLGRGVGVNVVWAISPGKDVDPAEQADVEALLAKVSAMADDAGIRDAALLLDDIPAEHTAALGQAHAALAKALLASMKARDPASRLWFVPSVYAGLAKDLASGDAAYLGALAELPADVPLAWTGQGVFSKTILLDDAAAFGQLAGRDASGVWIWDNYPVNDIEVLRRLHTHPITGRDSLLPGSAGLLSNPMRHALASLPAIASYAELSLDPPAYAAARAAGEPLQTASLALVLADAEGPPRALADLFAELVHHDTLWPDEAASKALTEALADHAAAASPGKARREAALALGTLLARLAVADVDLRRDLDDQALADEIDPYARATSLSARAALAALSQERAEALQDSAAADEARTEARCLWLGTNQPSWRTIQEAVEPLVPTEDVACPDEDPFSSPRAPGVSGAPEVGSAGLEYVVLGGPWSFDVPNLPSEPDTEAALVGPEEMTLSATGHIDWTPPRLGPFRLVALRSGDSGVTAVVRDLLVVEKLPPGASQEMASPPGCGCRSAGQPGRSEGTALVAIGLALAAARRLTRSRPHGD